MLGVGVVLMILIVVIVVSIVLVSLVMGVATLTKVLMVLKTVVSPTGVVAFGVIVVDNNRMGVLIECSLMTVDVGA